LRETKRIKIDDREIAVYELRVFEIKKIVKKALSAEGGIDQVANDMAELLPMATDLPIDEIEQMAPSELKKIWEAFREVNQAFFDSWRGLKDLGLLQAMGALRQATGASGARPTEPSAGLSAEDTGSPGTTATGGS
jgi:hypothetical protein